MSEYFDIFFSNKLEILYQNLKHVLFKINSSPFKRRLVVVYGPAMQTWLMFRMANDSDLKMAAGIEFIYLNQAFETLFKIFQDQPVYIPSQLELALAIEKEIKSILRHYIHLKDQEKEDWLPLIQYLKLDPEFLSPAIRLSRKMERRLVSLSQQLAHFFQDYGRFAGQMILNWKKRSQGWQSRLWNRLFQMGWNHPYQVFQRPIREVSHCEVHFFSISFISRTEFQFLRRLAHVVPVYYYLLSPCAVFWSDIRSDKESAYLQAYWQQKLGHSSQLPKLEELLRERNVLLANYGRLGREMALQIEESLAQTEATYLLPNHVEQLGEELSMNEDVQFEETDQPLTLLSAIQADILLMRNPQEGAIIDLDHEDFSIQIHIAPTKQREVQIIYHQLLHLIEQSKGSLYPYDIMIMAPQIAEYVPYIESVFGSQESQLDFQILDLGLQTQHEVVQGFLQLLALSDSRWEVSQLLQLFEHPSFQRRHQFTSSDYQLIQQWVETAGVCWGEDIKHRNEVLQRRHCQQGMAEETRIGTWEYGLTRLLIGLTAIQQRSSSFSLDVIPCEQIDFSQSELISKWIRLLHALRDDLAPLWDRTELKLEDWAHYLTCLLENYFAPDLQDSQSIENYESLQSQLSCFRIGSHHFKETLYSFQSIQIHLNTLLQHKSVVYRENSLNTVRFCSLLPLRSIPAKVIAMIGMQEEAFPRTNAHSSLNILIGQEEADYSPTFTDYDRYLFLETLHSAQEYLMISYQGYSHQEGKELQPSLVVGELMSYLDRYYRVRGQLPSYWCIQRHPFDSFHASYFQKGNQVNSYSLSDYQAAQIYYQNKKTLPHAFIDTFHYMEPSEKSNQDRIISLRQLSEVARNPIKFHLNHVLNVYLQKEEDRQFKNEEDLFVSHLDQFILKQLALKEPVEQILKRAEKEGKLPFGLFKTVASKKLKKEINELYSRLEKHRLSPQEIFQIEFCSSCTKPQQIEENNWLLPAIKLTDEKGKKVQVTGRLPYVTSKGLVVMGKASLSETWKAWPSFLLYHYATEIFPNELEKQLILTHTSQPKKSFLDRSDIYLKQFLGYHDLCLDNFSPLLPDWIPSILEGDAKALQEKMQRLFSDFFVDHQSHDLRWILNKRRLPCSKQMIKDWKQQAELLTGDFIHHWHANKIGVKEEE
jgi:exodeoxyribonuclease V gamma subunit